jgi:hypothetical protein
MPLPLALPAQRRDLDSPAGRLSLYCAQPEDLSAGLPPLLLVHSVNAAGSAAEVAPLFAHYRKQRAVYALESLMATQIPPLMATSNSPTLSAA